MTGHKKTLEEVKGDLEQQLIAAAKQLLLEVFSATDNSTLFEPLLHNIASRQFFRKYGFAYNDNPNLIHPIPGNLPGSEIKAVSKFCSIDNDPSNITVDMAAYINEAILSSAGLPAWMNANVRGELCAIAKRLLLIDTGRKWQLGEYSATYDGASGDPNQASYQVKSVLVYVNGTLTEDGVTANRCILYYMAAYYQVQSQSQAMRQAIEQQAFTKVPGAPHATPTDLNTLENVLLPYAQGLFKQKFGYNYMSTPPEIAVDVTQPYCKFNSKLFYTPDLASINGGRLENMIENELFAGLNLSILDVKATAIQEMMSQFGTIQSSQSAGAWISKFIDQTYHPKQAILHPIRANTIMLSFYGDNVTNNGQKIRVLFIYCMSMFYEITDREVFVRQDVLRKLVQNLHPTGPVTNEPDVLKDLLRDYARAEFKQEYGFDFQVAGSTAPDQVGTFVQRYQNLFTLNQYTVDAIKDYIEDTMFKPGTTGSFPVDIATVVFNSIVERVERYARDDQNHNNQWTSESNPIEYRRGDSTKKNIKEYSVFVHATGIGANDSDGGAAVKQTYLYYLSYFCSTPASADGGGFDN